VNAHVATLTSLATAHTGSTVEDTAPNAPAAGAFDLVLHEAFDTANGWTRSGTGPHYQCTQTITVPVPGGGPGGPLAGHTLQCVASLVSQDAQIAAIIHSNPFVLV
jgi:hypothetical protein